MAALKHRRFKTSRLKEAVGLGPFSQSEEPGERCRKGRSFYIFQKPRPLEFAVEESVEADVERNVGEEGKQPEGPTGFLFHGGAFGGAAARCF